MKKIALAAAAALTLAVALLPVLDAHAEKPASRAVEIATPRGPELAAVHHAPEEANGAAVVIAPGQGYHMDLPLITRAAEELSSAGFHVVRFDWAYFTAKEGRSADLVPEQEDVESVLAWARGIDGVSKVILAGKSLGSLVALNRATQRHDDLAGLALLTFPIHNPGAPEALFRDAAELDKAACPTLIVTGDRDPICSLGALYGLTSKTKSPPPVVVVPGEHSLRDPDRKDDQARTAEHVNTAVAALVLWCRRWVE